MQDITPVQINNPKMIKLNEYNQPWSIWYADGEIVEVEQRARPRATTYHKICDVYPGVDLICLEGMLNESLDRLDDPIYVSEFFEAKLILWHDSLYGGENESAD
jgi:hypothetical protein